MLEFILERKKKAEEIKKGKVNNKKMMDEIKLQLVEAEKNPEENNELLEALWAVFA